MYDVWFSRGTVACRCVYMTADAKDLEVVLGTHADKFEKGPKFRENFYDLLGKGIFNADGKVRE